jgi:hypothetical protein
LSFSRGVSSMVHSFEVQIQAYIKLHAYLCAF